MSVFDLEESLRRAELRLGALVPEGGRKTRSDRGLPRLDPQIVDLVRRLSGGQEKPRMVDILAEVKRSSDGLGKKPPARATLYRLIDALPGSSYQMTALPPDVRATLHNVEPTSTVLGAQVAFHCLNYGNQRAMSFAAGMPWLDLHQARRKRGWRAKSRGVLDAVCQARGI